jgi:hypothetical protein
MVILWISSVWFIQERSIRRLEPEKDSKKVPFLQANIGRSLRLKRSSANLGG